MLYLQKRTLVKLFVFAIILLFLILIREFNESSLFNIVISANLALSIYNLVTALRHRRVSLLVIFSAFFLLFFSIVPLIQYNTEYFFFSYRLSFTLLYFEKAAWIVSIFNFLASISYYNYLSFPTIRISFIPTSQRLILSRQLVISLGLIVLFLAVSLGLGLDTYLLRDVRGEMINKLSLPLYLFHNHFITPLSFFLAIMGVHEARLKNIQTNSWLVGIMVVVALMFNNPISLPRFYFLVLIISVYAFFFLKENKSGYYTLFLAPFFLVLIRVMSYLRNDHARDILERSSGVSDFIKLTLDVDAFEMSSLSLRYIHEDGFLFGKNLLGSLFFFVPRSLWENKAEASGSFIIQELYPADVWKYLGYPERFTNLSMPLSAELYLAFGFVGLVIGAWAFGYLMSTLDANVFYNNDILRGVRELGYMKIMQGAIIGLTFFILRGALLPSFAYTIGILTAFITALRVYNFKIKLGRVKYRGT